MIDLLAAIVVVLTSLLLAVDDRAWAVAVGAVQFAVSFVAIFAAIFFVAGSLGFLAGLIVG
ncbi:MAG: hypothetical protein FJX65_10270 [Alphaproteobacteria bacterium]|nr:hypothetical protein [Alphaproteobacteria bacterium]